MQELEPKESATPSDVPFYTPKMIPDVDSLNGGPVNRSTSPEERPEGISKVDEPPVVDETCVCPAGPPGERVRERSVSLTVFLHMFCGRFSTVRISVVELRLF